MREIKVEERRFILDLSESEAASVALELDESCVATAPARKIKEEIIKKLGYQPQQDIY